jgi:hypothetical protein
VKQNPPDKIPGQNLPHKILADKIPEQNIGSDLVYAQLFEDAKRMREQFNMPGMNVMDAELRAFAAYAKPPSVDVMDAELRILASGISTEAADTTATAGVPPDFSAFSVQEMVKTMRAQIQRVADDDNKLADDLIIYATGLGCQFVLGDILVVPRQWHPDHNNPQQVKPLERTAPKRYYLRMDAWMLPTVLQDRFLFADVTEPLVISAQRTRVGRLIHTGGRWQRERPMWPHYVFGDAFNDR